MLEVNEVIQGRSQRGTWVHVPPSPYVNFCHGHGPVGVLYRVSIFGPWTPLGTSVPQTLGLSPLLNSWLRPWSYTTLYATNFDDSSFWYYMIYGNIPKTTATSWLQPTSACGNWASCNFCYEPSCLTYNYYYFLCPLVLHSQGLRN